MRKIKKKRRKRLQNSKRLPALRVPAKASIWYVGSSAVARLLGALGTPVFTRLLTPEEYGLYPLYNTWLGIFTVIATLEVTGAVIYRGFQRYQDISEDFTSATLGLILTLSLSFSLICLLFRGTVNRLTGIDTGAVALMLLQIPATAIISLYTAKARFEYKYKSVALLNILTAVAIPLCAVGIIYATNIRGEARIIASSLTLTVTALPILLKTVNDSPRLFYIPVWKYLLFRSLPLLPHYFAMTMILKVGEISVNRLYGASALGKYSVALSLGMAMTVISGGILSSLSPWVIRRMKDGDILRVRDLLLILTKLICITCLGILALAPEALALFSSSAYHSILPAVYPIALSVIPTFISSALMSGGIYFEKSWLSALPAIISATVSAVLTLTLLPIIDYRFVSLFTLISYTTLAALNVLVFTKMAHQPPIHVTKTLTLFLLTCAYATLLFVFRNVMLSRFLLALPLLPPLFKVSKEALDRIKE